MPLSKIEAASKEELIKKIIEHEMALGKPREQAIAIALEEARKRGFKDAMPTATAYAEYSAQFGKCIRLNNALKVRVTIAAEMIQDYHRKEIPFLDRVLPSDVTYIKVLKAYDELCKMIDDLETRKISWIPFVMPHSSATFLKDQVPEEDREYFTAFISDGEVKGKVQEFEKDPITRKIKAWVYLPFKDHDSNFLIDVESGKVINVSIGFICDWTIGGVHNGMPYTLKQTNLKLGHLAGLLHAEGKCPAGICGINQDSVFNPASHLIQAYHEFYDPRTSLTKTENVGMVSNSDSCPCQSAPKVVPNGGLNNPLSHSHSKEITMTDDLELIKKENADLKAQLKAIQDSQVSAKLTVAEQELKDARLQLETNKQLLAKKDEEVKHMEEKCKKQSDEMIEKLALIPLIEGKLGADASFDGKKIKELCLHDMKIIAATLKGHADVQTKEKGFSAKPSQEAHDAKLLGAPEEAKPLPEIAISNKDLLKVGGK